MPQQWLRLVLAVLMRATVVTWADIVMAVFVFQGCFLAVEALLKKNMQLVIVAAVVIALLQVRVCLGRPREN